MLCLSLAAAVGLHAETYRAVTDVGELTEGDKIVVLAQKSNGDFIGMSDAAWTSSTISFKSVAVTLNDDGTLTNPGAKGIVVITLSGNETDGWRLYTEITGKAGYIGNQKAATGSAIAILAESAITDALQDAFKWSLDPSADKNSMMLNSTGNYTHLYYNSSSYWRCFAGQTSTSYLKPLIYKKDAQTADPVFGGFEGPDFFGTLNLTMSVPTGPADIYYSYTEPDATCEPDLADGTWTQYTAPLALTETTTIYAVAKQEGLPLSGVVSATFTYCGEASLYKSVYRKVHAGEELSANDRILIGSVVGNTTNYGGTGTLYLPQPKLSSGSLVPLKWETYQEGEIVVGIDDTVISGVLSGDAEQGWRFYSTNPTEGFEGYLGRTANDYCTIIAPTAVTDWAAVTLTIDPEAASERVAIADTEVTNRYLYSYGSTYFKFYAVKTATQYLQPVIYKLDHSTVPTEPAEVSLSRPAEFYGYNVVTLSPGTETDASLGEVTFYYTFDAEADAADYASWNVYTEPIRIESDCTLRVIARQGSLEPSAEVSVVLTCAGEEKDYNNAYFRVYDQSELAEGDEIVVIADVHNSTKEFFSIAEEAPGTSSLGITDVTLLNNEEYTVNPQNVLLMRVEGNATDGWRFRTVSDVADGYFGQRTGSYSTVYSAEQIEEDGLWDNFTYTLNLTPQSSDTKRRYYVKNQNGYYLIGNNPTSSVTPNWQFLTLSGSSSAYFGSRIYKLDKTTKQSYAPEFDIIDTAFYGSMELVAVPHHHTVAAEGETSIYYTTTAPDESVAIDPVADGWTPYTAPVTVSETTTLYFVAIQGSYKVSEVSSVTLTREGEASEYKYVYRLVENGSDIHEDDIIIFVSDSPELGAYYTINPDKTGGYKGFPGAEVNLVTDRMIVNPTASLPLIVRADETEGWNLISYTGDERGLFGKSLSDGAAAVTDEASITSDNRSKFQFNFNMPVADTQTARRKAVTVVYGSYFLIYDKNSTEANKVWRVTSTSSSTYYGARVYRLERETAPSFVPVVSCDEPDFYGSVSVAAAPNALTASQYGETTLYYTTAELEPGVAVDVNDGNWSVYSEPVVVTETSTLSFVAVQGTLTPSEPISVSLRRMGDLSDYHDVYRLVTDESQLATGDEVILVSDSPELDVYYTLVPATTNSKEITLVNERLIVNPEGVMNLKLEEVTDEENASTWRLYADNEEVNGYVGSNGSAVYYYSGEDVNDDNSPYYTMTLTFGATTTTGRRAAVKNGSNYNLILSGNSKKWLFTSGSNTYYYGARIYRLDKSLPVTSDVVAPEMSSSEGSLFAGSTEITMTTVYTQDVALYYTLADVDVNAVDIADGNWTLYDGPFAVTESAVVKGVAVKDSKVSPVATLEVSKMGEYATVAEVIADAEVGEPCCLTGDVVVEGVYNEGATKYLFVSDTDGAASLMITLSGATFNAYETGEIISSLKFERTAYAGTMPAAKATAFIATYPTTSPARVEAEKTPAPRPLDGWDANYLAGMAIFENVVLYEDAEGYVVFDLPDGSTVMIDPELGVVIPAELGDLYDVEGYLVEKADGHHVYFYAVEERSAAAVIVVKKVDGGVEVTFAADDEETALPAGANVHYAMLTGSDVSESHLDTVETPTTSHELWDGQPITVTANAAIKAVVAEDGKRVSSPAARFVNYDELTGISLITAPGSDAVEIYDIHGRRVETGRNLVPGCYIVRTNGEAVKILVK